MTVIPELVIQTAVVRGFNAIREDPRLLDDLFRDTSQRQLQNIKDFIMKTPIDFSVNYPKKTQLSLPSLVLLLRNESEAQTFLGDHMGTSPNYDLPDNEITYDTLGGHGASTSDLGGLPKKILGPLSVVSADENSITVETGALSAMLEEPPGCAMLYVVGGAGAGEVYPIVRFSSSSLDIQGTFVAQLDSTSLVDIREVDDSLEAVGQPSRVYSASSHIERLGSNYETQYQISVIAGHQNEVIYLYSVLKAILLSQRAYLEGQGIIAFGISGSDFAPRSEYIPSDVFQRVMNLKFTYPFSLHEELDTFNTINVSLSAEDPNTGDAPCELLTTTITLNPDD